MVDVAVHHPRMDGLAAAKQAMTFLLLISLPLDATLGERLAGERLRRLATALSGPAGAITLLQLRELVRGLVRGLGCGTESGE